MVSKVEIKVRYNETDKMGVVYHSNYLIYLELGRTKYLEDMGFDYAKLEERNIMFPVREVGITYLSPIRFGETIVVETEVAEFSSIKTVYKHKIKNTNGDLKSEATSTVVCVSSETFKLTKIEKFAKDVYDAYMADYKK